MTATKICTKCGIEKRVSEFAKDRRLPLGIQAKCRNCINQYHAAHYAANKASYRTSTMTWRAANPERHRSYNAQWRAANADRLKEAASARAKANPEAGRIRVLNRQARREANGGKLSDGLAEKLFILQKGKCACCANPLGSDYHMDHIVPLARGGPNTDNNIQLLRALCNRQKGAKDPVAFMQSRGRLL